MSLTSPAAGAYPNSFHDNFDCSNLTSKIQYSFSPSSGKPCPTMLVISGTPFYSCMFSVHFNFCCLIISMVSFTLVCSLSHVDLFLCLKVIPSFTLSIDLL